MLSHYCAQGQTFRGTFVWSCFTPPPERPVQRGLPSPSYGREIDAFTASIPNRRSLRKDPLGKIPSLEDPLGLEKVHSSSTILRSRCIPRIPWIAATVPRWRMFRWQRHWSAGRSDHLSTGWGPRVPPDATAGALP